MKTKTPKIKPMSDARKAIFAKYSWANPEVTQSYHTQLETDFEKIKKAYTPSPDIIKLFPNDEISECLPFNGNKEHDGNLILEKALINNSPEKRNARYKRAHDRLLASCKQKKPFKEIFGQSLDKYWDGYLGFDVVKFDQEIAKPTDNESTMDAIKRQWGEQGLTVINALIK